MERTKKIIVVALVLISMLSIGMVWAKGQEEKSEASAASVEGGENDVIEVGLSFASKRTVFFQQAEDMVIAAAKEWEKETGRKMNFTITVADTDVARQTAQIEDLIAQKVDVILACPLDSKAICSSITAAKKEEINFLTIIRPESPECDTGADGYIGIDTVHQAYVAGKYLIEKMQEDGVTPRIIQVIGDLRDENSVNRQAGYEKVAKEFGVEIVQTVPSEWDPDKALAGLSAALQAHPEANALFVASDFLHGAIQTALERVDRYYPYGHPKHFYYANLDVQPNALEAIEQGFIDCDTLWDHYLQGYAAVEAIATLADGRTLPDRNILVQARLATPDNVKTMEYNSSYDYR
jgi:ABC-type sugar transport system substrate-binding protein